MLIQSRGTRTSSLCHDCWSCMDGRTFEKNSTDFRGLHKARAHRSLDMLYSCIAISTAAHSEQHYSKDPILPSDVSLMPLPQPLTPLGFVLSEAK